jgi:hypothetical protein
VTKQFNAVLYSLLLMLTVPAGGLQKALAAGDHLDHKDAAARKLHRADFRVSGASCVACLRRIGKTLREQKGVVKGDVSIFKPYWAIVIYDAGQTSMEKLLESVAKEKVKFEDIEDKSINSLPAIVIPKGLNNKAEEHGAGGTAQK